MLHICTYSRRIYSDYIAFFNNNCFVFSQLLLSKQRNPIHIEPMEENEQRIEINSYEQGVEDALRLFAWWKAGVRYVGCGITTLAQALSNNKKEMEKLRGKL